MTKRCVRCDQSDVQFRGQRNTCRQCESRERRAREKRAMQRPQAVINALVDAVPMGFEVTSISTGLDGTGFADKQWLQAKPEGLSTEEIQEAIPAGHRLKGVSTLVGGSGQVVAQWIKTNVDKNEIDPVVVLREAFAEGVPLSTVGSYPNDYRDEDLLAIIPVGDPHFGMLACKAETGDTFNLEIAERNMLVAAAHLIDCAPNAAQALIIWIGDNVHSDGQANTTTKGTRVDVDSRTSKMLGVTIRAFKKTIYMAKEKFGKVHVIVERGNHDELLSMVIALALGEHFEGDQDVFIDMSPEFYHWFRFGQNLIGTHHGDRAKPMDLMAVMANDRAKDWGDTKHRRFYCGHIHHEVVKEVPGVVVEYLRTLAPSDAWHRAQGYRSGHDLRLDVIHREYGMINRFIVGIQQVIASQ